MRLEAGAWVARMAEGAADVERAQALRHLCFRAARGLTAEPGREADRFDAWCQHLMIEDRAGRLVGGFRALILPADRIAESYSGQFYDLAPLARRDGRVLELGRFCTHPEARHPDILRLALAAITRMVDMGGVGLMFGCSSFEGADPLRHGQALAYLGRHHRAPFGAGPGRGSAEAVALPDLPFDPKGAEAGLPPLLRSYLALGGWVSDHAVIDRDLDTLHVLTAVEVATIPPARARALRALAREGQNS
ncbi:MAG: GNAT family N-acetyltransferase [Paracoccaceae bacterium]